MAKTAKENNVVHAISISTSSPILSTPLNSSVSSSTICFNRCEKNISQNSNNIPNPHSSSPLLKHQQKFVQNKKQEYEYSITPLKASNTVSVNVRNKTIFEVSNYYPESQSIFESENLADFSKQSYDNAHDKSKLVDSTIETGDDIASIAKQISDHAEIIYQNWKARGLAPAEIFNCEISPNSLRLLKNNLELPEFLINSPDMSNNNLEKLVNNFINEDKARQLTSGKKVDFSAVGVSCTNTEYSTNINESNKKVNSLSISSGTIRDTLRKFESINSTSSNNKPNFLTTTNKSFTSLQSTTPSDSYKANSSKNIPQSNKNVPNKTGDSTHHSSDSKTIPKTCNTLDKSSMMCGSAKLLPNSLFGSTKPQPPVKPASLIHHINQNHQLNDATFSVSLSPLNSNKPKQPMLAGLPIQKLPNQKSDNESKIDDNTDNVGKIISNTTTSIISTVLEKKTPSAKQQKQTETKSYKKKSIVSSKQQNNYILPSLPVSSVTNCMSEGGQFSIESIGEEDSLINSSRTGAIQNKNDNNIRIDKKISDLKRKVTQPEYKSNYESNVQSLVTSKENNFNKSTEKSSNSTVLCNKNNVNTKNSTNKTPNIESLQKLSLENTKSSELSTSTTTKNLQCKAINSNENNCSQPMELVLPANISNKTDIFSKSSFMTNTSSALAPKSGSIRTKMRPNTTMVTNANSIEISKIKNINPVQPFLTRGSVAERIMMFEKCPDIIMTPFRHVNRDTQYKIKNPKLHAVHTMVPKSENQSHTTLQRAVRGSNAKNVYIPRFHYPHGKPLPNITQETIIQQVKAAFDAFPNNQCTKQDFHKILKLCNLPLYWRMPFISCAQIMSGGLIDGYRFVDFWKQMSVYCHDSESRFVYILSRAQRSRPYILPEDLTPLVQDVVDTHPGLAFLKEASEFHSRYIHTVISRIFYTVNRSWSNRITVSELRRSNLLQVIQLLEEEEDINQIMAFFSYEHFYVIYCKFWELDRDHDLFIDQNDLAQHNNHALSTRIIERIFSGCVTRGEKARIPGSSDQKMSYTDFVWFLLSEEDKMNLTSIEYWFRCMDLDGDGIISMYELEYFYEEQQERMFSLGIETLPFEDCLCQMLDMIKPKKPGCITLTDLKRCKMTSVFFDTFFNLVKYLEYEQRDPFASQKDNDDMTDWDRYAAQEYELLVAEENDAQGSYDEEDEDSEAAFDISDVNSRQR